MKTRTEAIKATEKELMSQISQMQGVNWIDYKHANEQIIISVNHGYLYPVIMFLKDECNGIFLFDKEVENHGYSYIYADYDVNAKRCPIEFLK